MAREEVRDAAFEEQQRKERADRMAWWSLGFLGLLVVIGLVMEGISALVGFVN